MLVQDPSGLAWRWLQEMYAENAQIISSGDLNKCRHETYQESGHLSDRDNITGLEEQQETNDDQKNLQEKEKKGQSIGRNNDFKKALVCSIEEGKVLLLNLESIQWSSIEPLHDLIWCCSQVLGSKGQSIRCICQGLLIRRKLDKYRFKIYLLKLGSIRNYETS